MPKFNIFEEIVIEKYILPKVKNEKKKMKENKNIKNIKFINIFPKGKFQAQIALLMNSIKHSRKEKKKTNKQEHQAYTKHFQKNGE